MAIESFRDLIVWQKSMRLVEVVHHLLDNIRAREGSDLSNQMCRAAISIPSNIAEGFRRMSRKDYARFIHIALGSASELETQIIIVRRLYSPSSLEFLQAEQLVIEVQKMLNRLSTRLKTSE
jgi:four helix bundle protein